MKMQIVERGQGIHISPETPEETKALEYLVERNRTNAMNFQIIGKPISVVGNIQDAIAHPSGFIAITVGPANPMPAKHG